MELGWCFKCYMWGKGYVIEVVEFVKEVLYDIGVEKFFVIVNL